MSNVVSKVPLPVEKYRLPCESLAIRAPDIQMPPSLPFGVELNTPSSTKLVLL